MMFYRFHENGGQAVAFTQDISGANLPKLEGAWKADGQTEIREGGLKRLGVDPAEIIEAVAQDGFFLSALRRPGSMG